jgi:hypothetical protein
MLVTSFVKKRHGSLYHWVLLACSCGGSCFRIMDERLPLFVRIAHHSHAASLQRRRLCLVRRLSFSGHAVML